jgi:hypothetical protein
MGMPGESDRCEALPLGLSGERLRGAGHGVTPRAGSKLDQSVGFGQVADISAAKSAPRKH